VGLDERGGDAGGQGHDQLAGAERGADLVEQVAHVLGLDHDRDRLRLGRGLDVADHRDAVPLLELARPLGPLLAHQQLVDAPARTDQAGQQGLAHDTGAEDGGLLHRTHFLEMRERRKNDRFCGRSASRRIR
jgi:hypothetical protein